MTNPKGEKIKHIVRPTIVAQSVHSAFNEGQLLPVIVVVSRKDPRTNKKRLVVVFVPPWMVVPEPGDKVE